MSTSSPDSNVSTSFVSCSLRPASESRISFLSAINFFSVYLQILFSFEPSPIKLPLISMFDVDSLKCFVHNSIRIFCQKGKHFLEELWLVKMRL